MVLCWLSVQGLLSTPHVLHSTITAGLEPSGQNGYGGACRGVQCLPHNRLAVPFQQGLPRWSRLPQTSKIYFTDGRFHSS